MVPPYPLQTATYYQSLTYNQYENEWWLLCNSSTGRIYQQKEYLHTVPSYSVKGQFHFIPFYNDSYKSIISILNGKHWCNINQMKSQSFQNYH